MRGMEPVGVETIWPARDGWVAGLGAEAVAVGAVDVDVGVGVGFVDVAVVAVVVVVVVVVVGVVAGALGTARGCDMGVS